jgi:FKBP-type peptidyl-prolyl cis-trans isomerase
MSTTKSQRIGIWVIAVVMMVGTIGSFFVVVLANTNATTDQKKQAKLQQEYLDYQAKVKKQDDELSTQYFGEFSQYASRPAAFDAASVTSLAKEDLKIGDGEEIKEGTAYSAYYIGWNPTGKIFDQSISDGKLKTPIPGGNLIAGWNEGVIGMKIGGVRELSIPADKAYGAAGSGEDIPANTPIKFVVMVIAKPTTIPQPDFSAFQ